MEHIDELYNAYGILLAKKIVKDDKGILSGISDEEIYESINICYQNCYGRSLDIKKNKKKLYEYAKEMSRYRLLSENIKIMLMRICDYDDETVDLFMLKNLMSIYENIYAQVWKYVDNFISFEECGLSKLTKEETINIVRNILKSVDPSLEWLNLYNNILNKKIIYLNELNGDEKKELYDSLADYNNNYYENACVKRKDDDAIILLTYNGDTLDVVNTIHEFIHYINEHKHKGIIEVNVLTEFPSIFYEYYALEYLRKMGYSEMEIKNLEDTRVYDLWHCIMNTYILGYYIKIFKENYEITEDLDIKYYLLMFSDTEELTFDDIKKSVHKECDYCTELMMSNPSLLRRVTSYVVGSYLTLNSINRVDSDMLDIMKEYTENIDDYNPYDIFVGLGIDIDGIDLKKCEKRRKKVRN